MHHLTEENIKFANEFLKENNLSDKFVIGIHPGGKNDMA